MLMFRLSQGMMLLICPFIVLVKLISWLFHFLEWCLKEITWPLSTYICLSDKQLCNSTALIKCQNIYRNRIMPSRMLGYFLARQSSFPPLQLHFSSTSVTSLQCFLLSLYLNLPLAKNMNHSIFFGVVESHDYLEMILFSVRGRASTKLPFKKIILNFYFII